jgi:hypothetical protein
MKAVGISKIACRRSTQIRPSLRLFILLSAVLNNAALAQSGNSPEVRQRVVRLADQTQIHLLEAGRSTAVSRSDRPGISLMLLAAGRSSLFLRSRYFRSSKNVLASCIAGGKGF